MVMLWEIIGKNKRKLSKGTGNIKSALCFNIYCINFDYSGRTLWITAPNRYWNSKYDLLGVNSYISLSRNSI